MEPVKRVGLDDRVVYRANHKSARVIMFHKSRPTYVKIVFDESGDTMWVPVAMLLPFVDQQMVTARREYMRWLRARARALVESNKHPDEITPHPEGKWSVSSVRTESGKRRWLGYPPNGMGVVVRDDWESMMREVSARTMIDYDRYLEEMWSKPCVSR